MGGQCQNETSQTHQPLISDTCLAFPSCQVTSTTANICGFLDCVRFGPVSSLDCSWGDHLCYLRGKLSSFPHSYDYLLFC